MEAAGPGEKSPVAVTPAPRPATGLKSPAGVAIAAEGGGGAGASRERTCRAAALSDLCASDQRPATLRKDDLLLSYRAATTRFAAVGLPGQRR
jgi:hypothetical protein